MGTHVCTRCAQPIGLNLTRHKSLDGCIAAARMAGDRQACDRLRAIDEASFDKKQAEVKKYADEARLANLEVKRLKEKLEEKLEEKLSDDRPLSDAEVIGLATLGKLMPMFSPFGHPHFDERERMREVETRLRRELERRGILGRK